MAEIDLAKLGSPAYSCCMAGSITGAGAGPVTSAGFIDNVSTPVFYLSFPTEPLVLR